MVSLDTHVHVQTVEKLKVTDAEGTIVWACNNNDGSDNIFEDLLLGRVLTQSRAPQLLVRKAQAEAMSELFEANRKADEAQKELEHHLQIEDEGKHETTTTTTTTIATNETLEEQAQKTESVQTSTTSAHHSPHVDADLLKFLSRVEAIANKQEKKNADSTSNTTKQQPQRKRQPASTSPSQSTSFLSQLSQMFSNMLSKFGRSAVQPSQHEAVLADTQNEEAPPAKERSHHVPKRVIPAYKLYVNNNNNDNNSNGRDTQE